MGAVSLSVLARCAHGWPGNSGDSLSYLGARIIGRPVNDGVAMTASRVDVGSARDRSLYRGQIVSLARSRLSATVASASGPRLTVGTQLHVDPATQTVTGTATFTPQV